MIFIISYDIETYGILQNRRRSLGLINSQFLYYDRTPLHLQNTLFNYAVVVYNSVIYSVFTPKICYCSFSSHQNVPM